MGKRHSPRSRIWQFILVFLLVILVAGGFGAYRLYYYVMAPNIQLTSDDTYFYIRTGSTFNDVVIGLRENGYLLGENSFVWVAEQKKYTKNVKPGRYRLTQGMNNNELINLLRSGAQEPIRVTFNSISSLEELAGKIGKQLEADSAQFADYFMQDSVREYFGFTHQTFLAMFIPNTYEFYWNTNPVGFTERMADEFRTYWNDERKAKAARLKLVQSEVATLASIVQAETRKADEMPVVAGLYINRLRQGIKLQADPTVKFAVGDPSLRRIYFKHLEVESPYNTYKYAGLPPGPIAMPERQALDAVLNYESHRYIYMCAKPDYSGYHNFAATLREHNRNRQKYLAFLRKEGIR